MRDADPALAWTDIPWIMSVTRSGVAGVVTAAWLASYAAGCVVAQTPPASTPPAQPAPTPPKDPTAPPAEAAEDQAGDGVDAPAAVPPSEQDPGLSDRSLGDVMDAQQTPRGEVRIAPTRPAAPSMPATRAAPKPTGLPGLAQESGGLPSRRFYPEGTFLSKRRGVLVKTTAGDLIFVPARDSRGRGEAPMVLLPGQTLSRLEAVPGVDQPGTTVVLSGQVFVYFDRQYLLTSVYALESRAEGSAGVASPPGAGSAAAAPAPTPKAPGATSASDDPAVADLIKELETKRGSLKAVDPVVMPASPAGVDENAEARPRAGSDSADSRLLPEGMVINNRRGRIVRLTGAGGGGTSGPLAVAFDGDTDSPPPRPMVLLRCRALQRLEERFKAGGEGQAVHVSGRVFVYGGRNYFLPTLIQSPVGTDVITRQ